jgi:hypothetical protein
MLFPSRKCWFARQLQIPGDGHKSVGEICKYPKLVTLNLKHAIISTIGDYKRSGLPQSRPVLWQFEKLKHLVLRGTAIRKVEDLPDLSCLAGQVVVDICDLPFAVDFRLVERLLHAHRVLVRSEPVLVVSSNYRASASYVYHDSTERFIVEAILTDPTRLAAIAKRLAEPMFLYIE